MKIGKPIKYLAVDPKEIMNRVKNHLKKKTEERIKSLEKVKDTKIFNDLVLLHKQGIINLDPSSLLGAVKGRKNIYNQMESLIKEARNSVCLVTTPEGLLRKLDFLKSSIRKMKNVRVNILTQLTKESKEASRELEGLASIKFTDKINSRFCIVDGKNILFSMVDDKKIHENYDLSIWADTEFFASAVQKMFDQTWKCLK
jgi:sugar-specific transcriptional regulator TrmB